MKCVAGHQPNLYPYAGFFAKAASVDLFVIADNTQYVSKEFHNRNRILLLNGSPAWLSVPVKTSGCYRQKINEAEIDNSRDWRRIHRKSILVNYRKSAYFNSFSSPFFDLLEKEWTLLADYNTAVIRLCFELLGISTPLELASDLGVTGRATGYIEDICRKTGAGAYMHGRHAYDYVDFESLAKAGITSFIQNYRAVEYRQLHGRAFIPNLSILDILFNCGPDSMEVIMKGHSAAPFSQG